MSGWHTGPLALFDLETTGVDPHRDRIVTACVVEVGPDLDPMLRRTSKAHNWLANPGIDIPEGAAAIHGVTTEQAQTSGVDPAGVVHEVIELLARATKAGAPIVGMNVTYDLTMLWAEALRHGGHELAARVVELQPVVDVYVLDKQVDPYRKGSRKLIDVSAHYGVALSAEGAHGAEADALAAGRIAWRIASTWAGIGNMALDELHEAQVLWKRDQAESFGKYLRKQGKTDDVCRSWPIQPAPEGWTPEQLPAPREQVA